MIALLRELKRRNAPLYWFGWFCFASAGCSIAMIQLTGNLVLGINAWIKPMKFFVSSSVFSWTMAWFMTYLNARRKVRVYTWFSIAILLFELIVITWQAANGRLSHFNITSPFYAMLFAAMGIGITAFMLWTAYINYLFFRQQRFSIPMPYVWGIRLGILLFVLFSFEGGLMAARLSHTVGAADGGAGLPLVNWNKQYGDLRIAHFFGIHSLQVLPVFGFYFARTNRSAIFFSIAYFLFALLLFVQAMMGLPLL